MTPPRLLAVDALKIAKLALDDAIQACNNADSNFVRVIEPLLAARNTVATLATHLSKVPK